VKIKKYDVVYVNVNGESKGSVQTGARPAVILQNDKGNFFSPTTIVAFITSKIKREDLPTHVILKGYDRFKESMVLLEQITTIDKKDIDGKIDELKAEDRMRVDAALLVSLGFIDTGN